MWSRRLTQPDVVRCDQGEPARGEQRSHTFAFKCWRGWRVILQGVGAVSEGDDTNRFHIRRKRQQSGCGRSPAARIDRRVGDSVKGDATFYGDARPAYRNQALRHFLARRAEEKIRADKASPAHFTVAFAKVDQASRHR